MRMLAGIVGRSGAPVTLTGDASLTRRPMARIVTPLARMGATLVTAKAAVRRSRSPVARCAASRTTCRWRSAQVA